MQRRGGREGGLLCVGLASNQAGASASHRRCWSPPRPRQPASGVCTPITAAKRRGQCDTAELQMPSQTLPMRMASSKAEFRSEGGIPPLVTLLESLDSKVTTSPQTIPQKCNIGRQSQDVLNAHVMCAKDILLGNLNFLLMLFQLHYASFPPPGPNARDRGPISPVFLTTAVN